MPDERTIIERTRARSGWRIGHVEARPVGRIADASPGCASGRSHPTGRSSCGPTGTSDGVPSQPRTIR